MFSHCGNFRRVLFTNYSQRLSTVFNKNIFRYRLFTNNFDYIFNRNRFGSAYRAFFSSLQLLEFRIWNSLDSQRYLQFSTQIYSDIGCLLTASTIFYIATGLVRPIASFSSSTTTRISYPEFAPAPSSFSFSL